MVRYLRFASLLLSVLVVAGVSTLAAGPASASTPSPQGASSTSYLCWGYAGCSRAGMGNAGYASVSRTMYWRMYSGHNCTNYAAYRMVHSGLPNSRPWSGSGNATNWGAAMSRITNGTPAVGAVAWWRAYVSPAGSAGHVAYVERIIDANTIVVSQDSWGGDFSWKRITRGGGQWPSGFVHFNDLAQRNTAKPSVSGTPQVGATLTAKPGSWSLPGATYRYQWRAGGVDVAGATASTLLLKQAQAGKQVTVRVTAVTSGYSNVSATSAATAAVRAVAVTNAVRPSITGTPAVGNTLYATAGSWTPAGTTLAYQWMSRGLPLAGQTGRSITLPPELVGRHVGVKITGTTPGYDALSVKAPRSEVIAPATVGLSEPASVTGVPRPGELLTATYGAPSPDEAKVSLQWLRDGVPVVGATRSTYRLGTVDLGHRVTARVSALVPGEAEAYRPLVATPVATPRVRAVPAVTVAATPGRRSVKLTAGVTAPGVSPLTGTIGVRQGDTLLGVIQVQRGTGTLTLASLPAGSHTFRLSLRRTDTVEPTTVYRTVRIP